MAYTKRRRYSKKKKSFSKRRRTPRYRLYKSLQKNDKFTTILREANYKLLDVDELIQYDQAWRPTLFDITNFTNFTNIWDAYKINFIKLIFRPTISTTNAATGSLPVPQYAVLVDRDDNTGQATGDPFATICGKPKTRKRLVTQGMVMKWKPNLLAPVYQSATATGYRRLYDTYLDSNDAKIPYYGVQVVVENGIGQTLNYQIKVELQLGVTFKNRNNS